MQNQYPFRIHQKKDFLYPHSESSFNWSTGNVEKHHHTFYEFFLVTKGEYVHYLNYQPANIKRGDFMMITPNDTHWFIVKPGTNAQHINFCATPEKFKQLCNALSDTLYEEITAKEPSLISLQPYQIDFFTNCAAQINLNELHEKNMSRNLMIINEMLMFALSTVYKTLYIPQENYPLWFQELLTKMHSPEFISMRVKDVYSLSYYAPATTIRFFKKYLGETIVSYFIKIKMQHACKAFINTDATTLTIASSLAYDSLSAFNHAFKSYTGMSPTEYKKIHKNIPDNLHTP